jgi:putative ABC transport system ATP-binding protein
MQNHPISVLEPPFVEVSKLGLTYSRGSQKVAALRGVDLAIERGEFLCVTGRSGSGKSSLLHLLGALRRPDTGQIRVGSTQVHTLTPTLAALFRRRVAGVLFQFFNLLPMLTVYQNVAFPLSLDRFRGERLHGSVDRMLRDLGLTKLRDRFPDELSGGQLQRVAIARALVIEPDLLLADEPTGSLDRSAGQEVCAVLQQAARDRNISILMVTHDEEAARYASRTLWLEDGQIHELDSPNRVSLQRPSVPILT